MAFITEPQGLRAPGRQRVEEDSPLQQIEQSVQQRAASLALDMAAPDSAATLQRLVEAEIDQWNLDHRRGLRPYELVEPALVAERAMRNLTGYGPLQGLLADGDVWEIMINAPTPSSCVAIAGLAATTTRAFTTTTTWCAPSPSCSTRPAATASSTPPKDSKTPSWPPAHGCTSCMATWPAAATWWSTSASSPPTPLAASTSWWPETCSMPPPPRS